MAEISECRSIRDVITRLTLYALVSVSSALPYCVHLFPLQFTNLRADITNISQNLREQKPRKFNRRTLPLHNGILCGLRELDFTIVPFVNLHVKGFTHRGKSKLLLLPTQIYLTMSSKPRLLRELVSTSMFSNDYQYTNYKLLNNVIDTQIAERVCVSLVIQTVH